MNVVDFIKKCNYKLQAVANDFEGHRHRKSTADLNQICVGHSHELV